MISNFVKLYKTSMSSFMMTVSALVKVTSSARVVLTTGSPDTAALSPGVS